MKYHGPVRLYKSHSRACAFADTVCKRWMPLSKGLIGWAVKQHPQTFGWAIALQFNTDGKRFAAYIGTKDDYSQKAADKLQAKQVSRKSR